MSGAQVHDALEELHSRLPASTLAFLRQRGAQRRAAGAPAAAGAAAASDGAASGAKAAAAERKVAQAGGGAPAEAASSPPGTFAAGGALNGSRPGTATGTALGTLASGPRAPRQQQQQQQDAGQRGAPGASLPGEVEEAPRSGGPGGPDERIHADPRLCARLRWGLGAELLSVQREGEVLLASQVIMRDQLRKVRGRSTRRCTVDEPCWHASKHRATLPRMPCDSMRKRNLGHHTGPCRRHPPCMPAKPLQDEGSVPEGYTATELLLLARSAHPAHRVAALRMLSDLLRASRPQPCDAGVAGAPPTPRAIPVPAHLLPPPAPQAARPAQSGDAAAAREAHWPQLWAYLAVELGVASHLRLALDDAHAPAAYAAAAALAALLGAGAAAEALLREAAEGLAPRMGTPSPRAAPLTRAAAGATWAVQAASDDAQRRRRQQQRQSQNGRAKGGGVAGEEDEEEETPEDVAALDAVAGLLQMRLLARVLYLLRDEQAPASAAQHLLMVLAAAAAHSEEAALLVAK